MARRPREEYCSILSAADNASARVQAKNISLEVWMFFVETKRWLKGRARNTPVF